jgi:endonuclease III
LNRKKIEKAIFKKLPKEKKDKIQYCATMIIKKYNKYIDEYFNQLEEIPAIKESR